jgi:hypothetical protein
MSRSPAARNGGDSFARAVAFVLTLIFTSPNLAESTIPNIPWVAFALAVILLLPYGFREFVIPRRSLRESPKSMFPRLFPAIVPAILFLAAICIPTLYGADLTPTLVGLIKLTAILLVGLPVLVARPRLALSAFYGLIAAFWINFALMLTGVFFGGPAASLMMRGRWGTLLNHPGFLWRLSISVWFFAGYLAAKRHSLRNCAFFISISALVYLDGARTGLLFVLLGGLLLAFVLAAERGHLRRLLITGVIGAVGLGIIAGGLLSRITLPEEGGLARVGELAISVSTIGAAGLGDVEPARFIMFFDVTRAIRDHPFFGTGMASTTSDMGEAGPMNIHMTYLGLLGVVSYVWLTWGWISWWPKMLRRIRGLENDRTRALYYNAFFILLVCGLGACTYPLGDEWSDWISFLVAYALLWHLVGSQPKYQAPKRPCSPLPERPGPQFPSPPPSSGCAFGAKEAVAGVVHESHAGD